MQVERLNVEPEAFPLKLGHPPPDLCNLFFALSMAHTEVGNSMSWKQNLKGKLRIQKCMDHTLGKV